jgi:heme/copper-type cytochrome/quinol oxidase subunit 3
MYKREKKGKLSPFSTIFFVSMVCFFLCVFFSFFCLRRKDAKEKVFKTKGQKQEGKSGSQK